MSTVVEADWNDKLRALAQAREEAERQRAAEQSTLDENTEARIRALAHDFPAVWNDPATSHRDRKRMARLLLEDVTLLKSDRLHIHIRFQGGAVESLEIPLPKNAWRKRLTPPDVVARIEQLLGEHEEAEVALLLNAEGLRTGAGKSFDADAVQWVRYTHGLKTAKERLRETGKLTIREMAAQLDLTEGTVRAWARDGRLRAARHGRKAIWLIDPLDEQPNDILAAAARHRDEAATRPQRHKSICPKLRARVDELLGEGHHDAAVAEQPNAEGRSKATGAPFNTSTVREIRKRCGLRTLRTRMREAGKLTAPEMAVCLGIGLNTVRNWLRTGRLLGRRIGGEGREARWMFEPLVDQPEPIRELAAKRSTMERHRGILSDAAAGQGAV